MTEEEKEEPTIKERASSEESEINKTEAEFDEEPRKRLRPPSHPKRVLINSIIEEVPGQDSDEQTDDLHISIVNEANQFESKALKKRKRKMPSFVNEEGEVINDSHNKAASTSTFKTDESMRDYQYSLGQTEIQPQIYPNTDQKPVYNNSSSGKSMS